MDCVRDRWYNPGKHRRPLERGQRHSEPSAASYAIAVDSIWWAVFLLLLVKRRVSPHQPHTKKSATSNAIDRSVHKTVS
jgi:hypothetical protein